MVRDGTSLAGKDREGIFTREFLCPLINEFFYNHVRQNLNLTDSQICSGLGAEGYRTQSGFHFSPERKNKHLFTKSEVIKLLPPRTWLVAENKSLPSFRACPDFAITQPLPLSTVGEVKYFKCGSPDKAVRELYQASRQAIFYLGAFHGIYRSAMIVVADASPGHSFFEGLRLIRPELLRRFGTETDIHLLPIRLV